MKCIECGTIFSSGSKCPVCGGAAKSETNRAKATANTPSVKTRSRWALLVLTFMGLNDLYLYEYGRFAKKVLLGFVTFCVGWAIWQVIDIVKIVRGDTITDAKGNPVEW